MGGCCARNKVEPPLETQEKESKVKNTKSSSTTTLREIVTTGSSNRKTVKSYKFNDVVVLRSDKVLITNRIQLYI